MSDDLSPIVVSQNEDRHSVSTEDHEEDQISEGDQGCSKNGFSIGDYVEVINEPYKNYYATVIGSSYGNEIEIQYFERRGKY